MPLMQCFTIQRQGIKMKNFQGNYIKRISFYAGLIAFFVALRREFDREMPNLLFLLISSVIKKF